MIILEYQNIKTLLQKDYTPDWSEEVFVIKKVKNTIPWTHVIGDLNGDRNGYLALYLALLLLLVLLASCLNQIAYVLYMK